MNNVLATTGAILGAIVGMWAFAIVSVGLGTLEAKIDSCAKNNGIPEVGLFFDVNCREQLKPGER